MKKITAFLSKMLKGLVKNWPLKLLSLFLAICLWAGLITQDNTLTRERIFTDVVVSANGADTLQHNNGFIILSGLDEENLKVRFHADVPQNQYNNVTSANYNPRIDLTKISGTGEQTLKVQTTSSSLYGSVSSIIPDTITVVVDEYVTNYRVPVSISTTGSLKDGWYGTTPYSEPSTVTVSGPSTIVNQIACLHVEYSLSSVGEYSGRHRTALPFSFEDENGNIIESDQLEVSSENVVLRSVTVNQTLYPCKELSVSADSLTTGKPADGYEITGIEFSPQTLTVAAEQTVLDSLDCLITDNQLDISGSNQTVTGTLKLKKTSDIIHFDIDNITVSVKIDPVTVSRTFSGIKPVVYGLADHYRAVLSEKSLSLIVTGPKEILRTLRSSSITAYVDAENLEEGTHQLQIQLMIDGVDSELLIFTPEFSTVELTIAEKE